MMSVNDQNQGKERRRYFRIDDCIKLTFKKTDEQAVVQAGQADGDYLGKTSLSVTLESINHESQLILRRLERSSPDIAEYLKVMENKIELIARALLVQEKTDLVRKDNRNVNLSASGIAFECEETLQPGDLLELQMLLPANMVVIMTHCRVVYYREQRGSSAEYQHRVGVDYINIRDQDKELLVKYVTKKQMQQIRDHKKTV